MATAIAVGAIDDGSGTMAFLQSDLPPSTAPAKAVPARVAVRAVAAGATRPEARSNGWRVPLVAILVGAAFLAIPGYAVARATESIAIGILAADFAFLLVVAGWSAVASGRRR